jgi:DNA (cytosine-5)-methyltransferase 1
VVLARLHALLAREGHASPLKKEIRGLAWVVIRWAREVRPRVIVLENVEEFQTWGPLGDENGPTRRARARRSASGSASSPPRLPIEHRTLVAADYGTPTTRKRLFLIARCDGKPIVWPDAHARPRPSGARGAGGGDHRLVAPVPEHLRAQEAARRGDAPAHRGGDPRYVIGAAEPFIMPVTHQGDADRVHGIDEPLRTITAANRGELALVEPFIVRHGHYSTITGAGLRSGAAPARSAGSR